MNRLPIIRGGVIVSVICEGPEEYDYMNRLCELNVWNSQYRVELTNANGNGNIPARYQDKFQNGASDIVLVFCDTDKKPCEQYKDIKRKIDIFHGKEGVSDNIVIFGNPCTMQIVIEHWGEVMLKSSSKHSNAPIIESYTGIKNYDAHKEQRAEMMELISSDNYRNMVERVSKLTTNDEIINSSNFGFFMKCLENPDASWIKAINDILD